MKLLIFSTSVFYLLGLKITSHLESRLPSVNKAVIQKTLITPNPVSSTVQKETKPSATAKDTTISTQVQKGQLIPANSKNTKKQSTPSV